MARLNILVDSPLSDMLVAARGVPTDARDEMQEGTRTEGTSIWADELKGQAPTRLQTRALVEGARAAVDAEGVVLRSGGSLSVVANPAEHGGDASYPVVTKSRAGKSYKRRFGTAFGAPSRSGKVVDPAGKAAVERFAAVWLESATRAVLNAFGMRN